MNNYELLYILPSNMTGKEIKSTFLDIEKEVLKIGGKKLEILLNHPFLLKTEMSKEEGSEELKKLPVVKRKLAYSIKKNRFGFYCLFNFSIDGNNLKEIDKCLKANKNILRYFILQSDPMSKEKLIQLQKLFARKKAEQEKEKRKEEAKTAEKMKAKDERKISKIEEKETLAKKEKEIMSKENIKKKEEKTNKQIISKETVEKGNKKQEEKEEKEEKTIIKKKKKKIKLEDLEDKLDEILEDSMI